MSHLLKLLLEFEKSVFNLFFDVVRKDFFCAKKLRVIRVGCSLNDSTCVASYGLIELIYASIGQRQLVMNNVLRS